MMKYCANCAFDSSSPRHSLTAMHVIVKNEKKKETKRKEKKRKYRNFNLIFEMNFKKSAI